MSEICSLKDDANLADGVDGMDGVRRHIGFGVEIQEDDGDGERKMELVRDISQCSGTYCT